MISLGIYYANQCDKNKCTSIKIYNKNPNDRIRKKMVYIIGSFETKESSEKLKEMAINDPNEEIRSEAIFWLSDQRPTKEIANFLNSII